jgi:hypothetical protein
VTLIELRYGFRQPFRASAPAAFRWCTDFRPADASLFEDGRTRAVRRLAPNTLAMTDTPARGSGQPRITRLVRIFPEELAWTNTHLTGPYRYSQFWYRVEPRGRDRSALEFRGLKIERRPRAVPPREVARLARAEGRSDAATWREQLAPALDRDVGG